MPEIVAANGITLGGTPGVPSSVPGPHTKKMFRYGCIAARIGADVTHTIGIDWTYPVMLASGRGQLLDPVAGPMFARVRAGESINHPVNDATRFPEELELSKWVCKHAGCAGKHWPTKKALIAAHPDDKILRGREECHLYYAVYEEPAVDPVPVKGDQKAKPGKPARIMLLSDEE